MTKKILTMLIVVCAITMFPQKTFAAETTIENVADMFELSETDDKLKGIAEDSGLDDFSFKDTVIKIVTGEKDFNFSDILKSFLRTAAGGTADVLYIMKRVILLILLSAILETLTTSFASSGVSKLGEYICSAVLIITIMQSFYYSAQTAASAVSNITETTKTLQPLYMIIMTATGKATTMSIAVPILYSATAVITFGIQKIIIPGIIFAALITFINSLSERDMLMELAELMSFLCKWGVKICAGLFVFVMSLIKLGVPNTALIAGKSIKTAVEAVPVVGSLMSSAAETAAMLTTSMGNSIAAAAMLFIALISIVPVIRLAVIMIIYKLTAALTQPVASKRIVKCLDRAADYAGILTGLVFTTEIMFITVTALMLAV
ncbi:MAG: stage III sporulation protein AE [Candidatus Metalachnospira sp.]|nr:stage III sporulation protein AE [Candidatus Metalachnospira sp.]